jgi:hypothetical protein
MQRRVTFWLAAASLAAFVVGAGVLVTVSVTYGNLNPTFRSFASPNFGVLGGA